MSGGLGLPDLTLPRAVPTRVAVVAQAELTGRRVAETLRRDGMNVVSNAVSAEERVAPGTHTRADVLVVVDDGGCLAVGGLAPLRERFPDPPIVVVSALCGRRAIHDALNAGASGFVGEDDLETRLVPTV